MPHVTPQILLNSRESSEMQWTIYELFFLALRHQRLAHRLSVVGETRLGGGLRV